MSQEDYQAAVRSSRGRNAQRTGAAWEQQVIDLAHLMGWRVAGFRSARVETARGWRWMTPVKADGAGFPDLVLVRGDRLLFRELKVDGQKLTDQQALWLSDLREAGADAEVWTPGRWDTIVEELGR